METDSAAPTLGLMHYFRVLRRRWYAVLLGALAGVLAALGYLAATPTTSTAFASVDLKVVSSQPFNLQRPEPDLLNRTTEEQTARSPAVVGLVADELDRSIADIRSALEVVVLDESTVMQLHYTATDRDQAIQGADALADAFLEVRSTTSAERVDRILAEYDERVEVLREQLADTSAEAAQATGPQLAAIRADQVVIQAEIDILLQERSRLTGIDTTGGSVIAAAGDNRVEAAPDRPLVLATGLLAGLVLGLISAFAVDGIDRRIRDRHDVDATDCGPVLAIVRGRASATPATGEDVDAVRSVREHLLAAIPADAAVVSVAEVSRQEEPADVAVNLAVEMAAAGVPTDLVLAEYPPATVDRIGAGLDLKSSDEDPSEVPCYESAAHPGLRVHAPDPTHGTVNPSTMFVSRLRDSARGGGAPPMTIIALPPHASRSLVLAAGRLGTSVVTVCIAHDTSRRALGELADELASVNAVLQGTVLLTHRRPWTSRHGTARHEANKSEVRT